MNCKQGDIAVLINGKQAGAMMDVLYLEPQGRYIMPDGAVASSLNHEFPTWVCKSLGSPLRLVCGRVSMYSSCHDSRLRPIRGEPEKITETEKIHEPSPS